MKSRNGLHPQTAASADGPLREKARRVIERGLLPDRSPDHTWGGLGAGAACVVCGVAVTSDEMEIEVEFLDEGDAGARSYHVHVRCFAAWELERRLRTGGTATSLAVRKPLGGAPPAARPRRTGALP